MDITFLAQAVVPVVLGICLLVGYIIKQYIHKVPNDAIPVMVTILGVLLNIWVAGFAITPEIILSGMFSGLASTGLYELLRNMINKSGDK